MAESVDFSFSYSVSLSAFTVGLDSERWTHMIIGRRRYTMIHITYTYTIMYTYTYTLLRTMIHNYTYTMIHIHLHKDSHEHASIPPCAAG
jgi:hypothetical protein